MAIEVRLATRRNVQAYEQGLLWCRSPELTHTPPNALY